MYRNYINLQNSNKLVAIFLEDGKRILDMWWFQYGGSIPYDHKILQRLSQMEHKDMLYVTYKLKITRSVIGIKDSSPCVHRS
jgi:hypothetical protein